MTSKHRTPAEQKFWDEIAKALAVACIETKALQGCAHMIREVADELLRERRESAQQDK